MNYEAYRKNIKTGDLLVWSNQGSSGFVQWIIRLFTLSEYCHVGVAWVIGNRIMIIEAVRPYVRIFPLSRSLPFYHVRMHLDVKEEHLTKLLSRVGDSYSMRDAIVSYFKKPSVDNEWQCVELTKDFYRQFGLDFKDAWTPSHLVESLLSQSSPEKCYSLCLVD